MTLHELRPKEWLRQSKKKKIRRGVLSFLACFVVFCTVYAMVLPAITMDNTTFCAMEEHTHTDDCYTWRLICPLEETEGSEGHTHTDECYETRRELICDLEENEEHTHTDECYEEQQVLICTQEESEPVEGHTHTQECYERVLTCVLPEHTHSMMCYCDKSADVESWEQWEATLPEEISENWSEAVVAVALSQLDYLESTRNFIVNDAGAMKGYSRYGAWYGSAYGDWCAMFVSFCLHYAGVPSEVFPYEASCPRWVQALREKELLREPGQYIPAPGDLVFFDYEGDGEADHVGLVREIDLDEQTPKLVTIEGNSGERVAERTYVLDDDVTIMCYGELPENPELALIMRAPLRAPGDATVWFDGTLGQGTQVNYYPGSTNTCVTASNGLVTLPTSAGNPSGYVLNGWYDIVNRVYYDSSQLGQQISVPGNTVFYADWVPASDNYRDTGRGLASTVDISSFVTTELFDYNELINMKSGKANVTSITNYQHRETWSFDANQDSGFDFAFCQWAYHTANGGQPGRVGYLSNLNDRNVFHPGNPGRLELGIAQSESDTIVQSLFTNSGLPGVRRVGTGTNLYQYNSTTGYYYYDSNLNGASYQASEGRFYVYNNPTYIQGQTLRNGRWENSSDVSTAFMPLNSQRYVPERDGAGNFWFGMKNTIDFFLPEVPGTNNGNCNYSVAGTPMEFSFSGDDDVWVFVDGELVLDLGGLHGVVSGSIDFSKGTVNRNGTTVSLPASIREGEHTLTMYYLERGSSKSNCSIYFNICPRYSLNLTKMDAQTQQLLNGAEFSIYTDPNCSVPAMLWSSKEAHDAGESARCTFTAANGRLFCWGLSAGRTYYIKETRAPDSGYADVSGAVIALTLDSRGEPSVSLTDPTNLLGVTDVSRESEIQNIRMTVTNQKPQSTDIRAEKVWLDAQGNVTNQGEPIRLQLYRSTLQMGSADTCSVFVTTQFFSADGMGGSNSDTDPIIAGDYSRVIRVDSGSDLTMQLQSLAARAGFYSVVANGRTLSPENAVMGNENCYIGGSWGHSPIQSADYTLTDITSDQHVVITLIGYPDWQSGAISVENNIIASYTPTPHGSGTTPTVPTVKPDDAVPVGDPVTVTADENGVWSHQWIGLPLSDGTNDYYYYVEETHLDGYETTYSGNGTQWGTVTVTNREREETGVRLTLLKRSAGDDALPLSGARFDLYRPAGEGEDGVALSGLDGVYVRVNDTPVTTGSDGRAVWSGLEPGTYYLVETAAPTGYLLNPTPHRIDLTESSAQTQADDPVITGSSASPFVTLTNESREIPGNLIVEKNWFKLTESEGAPVEDEPPAGGVQFQLHRSYETAGQGVPVTVRGVHNNDPGGTILLQGEAAPDSTFRFYVYGEWSNGTPDSSFTVTCTGGTVQQLSQTQPVNSWYNAPVFEVTVPVGSTGVTIHVDSGQWYDHYTAGYMAGYEPQPPAGGGGMQDELVSVDGVDVFTLNEANGWHMGFDRAELGELPGVEYTYRVEETPVPEGYQVTYRTEQSGDGQQIYLIMDNVKDYYEYELPEAGGPGTSLLILLGILLTTGTMVFYGCVLIHGRKEARRRSDFLRIDPGDAPHL